MSNLSRQPHDSSGEIDMVLEDNRESAQSGETKNLCFTVGGRWSYPTYLLLAAILLLILFTFTDYGVTYDEEWRATYGEYIVRWYTSLFRDTSALEFWHLGNYGGFFDSLAQLAVQISPIGLFETRHLVNAFFGFLGFIAVYKIANRLAGPAAGFLALIFLILTPRYYGQIFNNPKDVPFAALFMCSLYFIIRAIDRFPRLSPREILPLGLLIGFTAGIRIGGIVLLGFLLVGFILWLVAKRFTTQTGRRAKHFLVRRL